MWPFIVGRSIVASYNRTKIEYRMFRRFFCDRSNAIDQISSLKAKTNPPIRLLRARAPIGTVGSADVAIAAMKARL